MIPLSAVIIGVVMCGVSNDQVGFATAAYADSVAKIETFGVEYEILTEVEVIEGGISLSDGPDSTVEKNVVLTKKVKQPRNTTRRWYRSGLQFHLGELSDGNWNTFSFDGQHCFESRKTLDGRTSIQVTSKTGIPSHVSLEPEVLLGNKVYGFPGTLTELLQQPGAMAEADTVENGHKSVLIRSAVFDSPFQVQAQAIVLLDCESDYLPRRIFVGPPNTDWSNLEGSPWYFDVQIQNFGKFADGTRTNSSIWLPTNATLHQPNVSVPEYRTTKMEVNVPIAEELFHPTAPDVSTQVLDARDPSNPEWFLVGKDGDYDKQLALLANKASAATIPRNNVRLWILILTGALLIAMLSARSRFKARGSRSDG